MTKLIVDISDDLHKSLKMQALKDDKTLRQLVTERLMKK
jgi:predicted HicB family RNase H-like nuclease